MKTLRTFWIITFVCINQSCTFSPRYNNSSSPYKGELKLDTNFKGVDSHCKMTEDLKLAYEKNQITLDPPISKYKGLSLNYNNKYINSPDFLGIRVDLNAPNAKPRLIGEHPMCIVYAFKSGFYIMENFSKDGIFQSARLVGGLREGPLDSGRQISYDYSEGSVNRQ